MCPPRRPAGIHTGHPRRAHLPPGAGRGGVRVFGAVPLRTAGVLGRGAGPGPAVLRAAQQYQLGVLEVIVENRRVEPDSPVEQISLEADLVRGQFLRTEPYRLRGVEGSRAVAARLVTGPHG